MDNFERWERMLKSVGTSPKVWTVFEEMKKEIEMQNEDIQRLETELMMSR